MDLHRTRQRLWTVGVLSTSLALATSFSTSADAQERAQSRTVSAADKARAADLFKKSADAYRQGDFKRAIDLLDEAYALDPQPVLTYNRARAAEGLGNADAAIAGYEKFLADEPKAPDRGAIEQRVATLKRQRDERAALERDRDARRDDPAPVPIPAPVPVSDSPPPAPPPEPTPPRSHTPLPYVVAGVGAVGLVTGAIVGSLALSKKDDAVAEPVQQTSMDLKDSADGLATTSTVFFVLGGVLVAAGVAWWIVDHAPPKNALRDPRQGKTGALAPRVTATGIGVSFP